MIDGNQLIVNKDSKFKIIDFEKKGNVVRFWLGDNECNDYWFDDGDDVPYDCNAGIVYCCFRRGFKDIAFPFDWEVKEPCDGELDCNWSKQDMKDCLVPCIVAAPPPQDEHYWYPDFKSLLARKDSLKFYFNDPMEPDYFVSYDEHYKESRIVYNSQER